MFSTAKNHKNHWFIGTSALLLMASAAAAQYTPGVGLPPSGPAIPPPRQQSYPWGGETPQRTTPSATPQQNIQPVQPDVVRIVQPGYQDPARPAHPDYVVQRLSDAQIGDLTASIALYPDPLLSVMLPAATFAEQLTYGERWLGQHPGADEPMIASLALDDSVKAVMHYPTVLKMMNDHLDWTQTLGLAFVYQRNDFMESIQRWRAQAIAVGTLGSTPQQDVLQQGGVVLIQPPPRQQVVYVPVYDPAVVYVRPIGPPHNIITFSGGGLSLSFVNNDVDWRQHEIRVPVHHDWDDHPGPGPGPGRGRGPDHNDRAVFVREGFRPPQGYPQKVVMPQPDRKVVTIPAMPGRGPNGPTGPTGPNGPGTTRW